MEAASPAASNTAARFGARALAVYECAHSIIEKNRTATPLCGIVKIASVDNHHHDKNFACTDGFMELSGTTKHHLMQT